ncbi:hypothetical protein F4819DRAFT_478336 [Hypoxylon fuscum]|nr:hypothetical protein F4819DRAFT_478336 [Hypoxylon fuscum]
MVLLPVALYGLEVPTHGIMIPAMQEDNVPGAGYRITMAAINPSEAPEADDEGNVPENPRSTLLLIRKRPSLDDELDDEYLDKLMGVGSSDDEDDDDYDDSDDDDEPNGGPSDPSKSKKARQEAALQKLIQAAQDEEDSDEEMGDDVKPKANGIAKSSKKGKQPAVSSDDEDDDSIDSDTIELDQLVICTLDTQRNYQQSLDLTIGPDEDVFFVVKGSFPVHLTGNYIIDTEEGSDDDEDEDDEDVYGIDGIDDYDTADSEVDELDNIKDPRITEIDTDEEEAPKLVVVESKKGKNKRRAEEAESLDDLMAKAEGAEGAKLSKKQQKKLKNNKGEAVEAEAEPAGAKSDKKVQFAKNLEQGPTGSAAAEKGASPGVKVVQGITLDDRKVGSGRTVKKGNKVDIRYIGKNQHDGKIFDANKKGPPFSFSVGKGQVIKGMDIGVQGMAVGGERRLIIPPQHGYGSKGSPPGIPPNSTLIFDIKLLAIK